MTGAPVAVTGLGAVTPLGPDVAALWDGLLTGRSGARLLDAAVIARAIAASESIAELDSLEARLRTDHPNEPALRDGGLLQRQIAARRSALTARR